MSIYDGGYSLFRASRKIGLRSGIVARVPFAGSGESGLDRSAEIIVPQIRWVRRLRRVLVHFARISRVESCLERVSAPGGHFEDYQSEGVNVRSSRRVIPTFRACSGEA